MKVKELIRTLMDMDPEATVCVEANSDPVAKVVKQYHTKGGNTVYIADETDYIDEVIELSDEPANMNRGTYALDLFLEEEVPFRLRELLWVDEDDIEKVEDEILDELCLARGGQFDFFDYDAFDSFITDILDKHNIHYGG